MALLHTNWDNTVRSLAEHLSKELGLLSTASVEAVLQQVMLVISAAATTSAHRQTPRQMLLPPWQSCCSSPGGYVSVATADFK